MIETSMLPQLVRLWLVSFVAMWALAGTASAQIAIEQQPDPGAWLATAMKRRSEGAPAEKALLALRTGRIAPSLAKDLVTMDWLLVGAYSYPEKKLSPGYVDERPCQLDIRRYLSDGSELHFSYSASCDDREHGKIVHTNFTMPPPVRGGLKKVKGVLYLELVAYGKPELHRVVSYDKGVLILDISYDGKPRSKRVKFRDVWIGIPRMFEWTAPAANPAP